MNIYDIFETKKGLYYNVNQRKRAGTSRSKNAPEAPSVADWKNAAKTAKEDINEGIEIVYELSEGAGQQLSVQQLAAISDAALDSAYGYGRSSPGNTFGWQANLKSASFAKQMIDRGVTDVEAISDAIHKGWNVTAQAFVKNPMAFDDSKTMAPEKLQAKIAQRQKLMTQQYAQLPEDEKEKDRVVARAMLQAINGEQSVAEAGEWPDKMSHDDLENMQRNHQKWSEQDTPSRTDPSATVEDFYHEVVRLGPGLGRDLLYFAAEEGDEPPHIVKAARQLYKKIARKAGLNPEIGGSDNNEVFDLMYDWVGKNYSNPGVAEAAPLARDARRELVAPTDRDRIRRELWKYVRSLDQEGSGNRAHAMAHSCPTWGRLYRQYNDDVSQLLSQAPTELLAQALQEIQSKFQGVAEGLEEITWIRPNFDYEWDEIEFQADAPQVPSDVRNYMARHFPNKQAWMKAVVHGRPVVVAPDHGQKIRNYPDNKRDLLNALSPQSHDPQGPAKKKRVNALFDKGGPIEMPIILQTEKGLWLIGGKTRLGTANLLKGIPAKVWMIGGKQGMTENFADGRNPQDKGDAKRHGINTKASVSSLRKTAKQGGRKGQLAHWLANMKAGRAKARKK